MAEIFQKKCFNSLMLQENKKHKTKNIFHEKSQKFFEISRGIFVLFFMLLFFAGQN